MKYTITGSAGHISKPLAEILLNRGHEVTVIGRNAEHLKPLTEKGAKAAIGSIDDVAFLKQAFAGADAVYTMVPPIFEVKDWKGYIEQIGKNYAEAIKASGVKYVVNLSSVGADQEEGCGPVTGLHRVENVFDTLTDVNIKHLRPGYFYVNFYSNIPMIKNMNLLGGNLGNSENLMILAAPEDIAEVAAEELLQLNFKGHSVRYIASDERTIGEVTNALGASIGKPDLPWVEFSDEQTLGGLQQAGLPEEIAKNYTEMSASIRTGKMWEDYLKNRPSSFGKTKLEDFAATFAQVYNAGK